jgi:hypothetical protein
MCHKIVGLAGCCLLLSWDILAAPRNEDPAPVYYYASTVGDKLVYEANDGDRSWTEVLEVTEARQKGAAVLVTLRGADGLKREPEPLRYAVSDKGVYVVGEGDDVLESPQCLLRLPFKKGETWEATRTTRDRETITTKYTSTGEEEVEVPAGKFRCVRVESECVLKGVTWTYTRWVAPRCGLVKEVLVGKEGVRSDYVSTVVLKSFNPGGK